MAKEITQSNVAKGTVTMPSPRIPQAKADSASTVRPATPAQRQLMICEAAYYIAEHRGFAPGCDVDDWLAAERQIDAVLTGSASASKGSDLRRHG